MPFANSPPPLSSAVLFAIVQPCTTLAPAPKNTPPAIVAQMVKELQKAMQTPAIKEAWERNGSDVPDVTGPAFAKMVSAEVERWRKVVKEANVKLD